jgi:arylsulfatase A-like enzyme
MMTKFLAIALLACAACPLLSQAADRPNVLFIAVDDLNDWIGCMGGHPQALTPNIDRLAERGVLFTNAHCAAPACNPSRAAVFSGRMADATGVWSNNSPKLSQLRPDVVQLPTAFAGAGYRTLGTGKLTGDKEKCFEDYYGVEQRWSPFQKSTVRYTDQELPTKGTHDPRHILQDSRGRTVILPLNRMPSDRRPLTKDGESFDWGPFDVPDSEFGDTRITDWAIERLNSGLDQPVFLGVGYYRPHIPLFAPKQFFERFEHTAAELPEVIDDDLNDLSDVACRWAIEPVTAGSHATVIEHQQWRQAVQAYLACVSYVDHQIGRLLDTLDSTSLTDNTLVVLWSDHGWHLGEKKHWGKWTGWERSTRVPLIIVPPKTMGERFAVGSRCDQPVGLIDLYPTLTELCNLIAPDGLDGHSLVPLLRQPNLHTDRAVITMFDAGNLSLRTDRWRLIRYADGSVELYDHHRDPHEWNNLAGADEYQPQQKALVEMLSKYLARKQTESNDS